MYVSNPRVDGPRAREILLTAKMPPKSSTKKKKNVNDERPPPEYDAAMADYYEAKATYDAEKVKLWASIPEDPIKKCPEQPYVKPWWIKEHEEQMAKMHPGFDLAGKRGGVGALSEAFQTLCMKEKEAKDAKEKGKAKENSKGAGKKDQNSEKFNIDELWIDEDLLVAALTGEEGLVVPPGLEFPK